MECLLKKKSILYSSILCVFIAKTTAQTTQAPMTVNLRCNFFIDGTNYDCLIDSASTPLLPTAIINFYGVHQSGRTNSNVTRLLITNSLMPMIIRSAFMTFPNLREYSFRNAFRTNIKRIQSQGFANVTGLQTVTIVNGNLAMIGSNAFLGSPTITQLNLQNNHLEDLPNDLLSPLSQLVQIDLSNNFITNIQQNFFSGQVAIINLNNNRITRLSGIIFGNRASLTQFHAQHNGIVAIGNQFLSGNMPNLRELNLMGNQCINNNWNNVNIGTSIPVINNALAQCFAAGNFNDNEI